MSRLPLWLRNGRDASTRDNHVDLPAYQIVRQPRQSIELILGPAINDNDILALDITGVFEAWRNPRRRSVNASGDLPPRNPITGIAGCCARAASGHAIAAPPSSVMNSRRLVCWERSIVRGDRG